jgi:hypothetical protein
LEEDVEHGFYLFVKIEKFVVVLISLSEFAVLLAGHLWLEQWHWRPVEIKLSGHAFFSLWWLIRQLLHIFLCLNLHV